MTETTEKENQNPDMAGVLADQLIEIVAEHLAYNRHRPFIKRQVELALYGPSKFNSSLPAKSMDIYQFENIHKRAKELLRERVVLMQEEAKDRSINVYTEILASTKSKDRDKLKAQERLDKILGIEGQEIDPMQRMQDTTIAAMEMLKEAAMLRGQPTSSDS